MTFVIPNRSKPHPLAMPRRRLGASGWTRSQRSILGSLEYLFVIVTLAMCLGGLRPLFSILAEDRGTTPTSMTEANLNFQIVSGTLYLVAAVFLLMHLSRFISLCRRNWVLLLLLVIVFLSAIWSIYPIVTARRVAALLLTTGFAAYLAMRFPPETGLKLLAWACGITAVASLILVAVDPATAIYTEGHHAGNWRGIFGHKNVMGRAMGLGLLAFVALLFVARPAGRLVAVAGATLCGGLLIMSMSKTAWVATLAMLVAVPFFMLLRPNRLSRALRLTIVGIATVTGLVLLALTYQYGLQLLGRDESLTGRVRLWELAINSGMHRSIFGAGYRSFWTEGGASDIYSTVSWGEDNIGNGHNGYLDTWLEIGFVGLLAFLLAAATCARRIVNHLNSRRRGVDLWFAMAVGYMLVSAWAEQVLMQQSDINWVIFVAILFWLTPPAATSRRQVERPRGASASNRGMRWARSPSHVIDGSGGMLRSRPGPLSTRSAAHVEARRIARLTHGNGT